MQAGPKLRHDNPGVVPFLSQLFLEEPLLREPSFGASFSYRSSCRPGRHRPGWIFEPALVDWSPVLHASVGAVKYADLAESSLSEVRHFDG